MNDSGWIEPGSLNREQAAQLHADNAAACDRFAARIDAGRAQDPSPAYGAQCDRAIATLAAEAADERELVAMLDAGDYPYPLAEEPQAG